MRYGPGQLSDALLAGRSEVDDILRDDRVDTLRFDAHVRATTLFMG